MLVDAPRGPEPRRGSDDTSQGSVDTNALLAAPSAYRSRQLAASTCAWTSRQGVSFAFALEAVQLTSLDDFWLCEPPSSQRVTLNRVWPVCTAPWYVHDTVASPLSPFVISCQPQRVVPSAPVVYGVPWNETGGYPVEYTTFAVQVAPGTLRA